MIMARYQRGFFFAIILLAFTRIVYVQSKILYGPNNHKYTLFTAELSWQKANKICKELNNGHLLILNEQDETNIVYELLRGKNPPKGIVYAGLNNFKNESLFRDILNRHVVEKFWEHGYPKNQTSGRFCVVINIYGYYQVHSCDDELYFICENVLF